MLNLVYYTIYGDDGDEYNYAILTEEDADKILNLLKHYIILFTTVDKDASMFDVFNSMVSYGIVFCNHTIEDVIQNDHVKHDVTIKLAIEACVPNYADILKAREEKKLKEKAEIEEKRRKNSELRERDLYLKLKKKYENE